MSPDRPQKWLQLGKSCVKIAGFVLRDDTIPQSKVLLVVASSMFFEGGFFSITTTIFGQTVGLFAFWGLAVGPLGFTARCQVAGHPTCITAIRLPTPATQAYTKAGLAPATKYTYQFQNPALKISGNSSRLGMFWTSGLVWEFILKARNVDFWLSSRLGRCQISNCLLCNVP